MVNHDHQCEFVNSNGNICVHWRLIPNGDVHLFYAHHNDNQSALMHAVLHDGSWYLSELYNDHECEQNGLHCQTGSLPIYSESKAYVLAGNEMLQIDLDEDYENRTDYDNDGVINRDDAFPYNDSEQSDYDLDGIGDNADIDDDNDGVDDLTDLFPLNELEQIDSDGDGIGDYADLDDDNDGYPMKWISSRWILLKTMTQIAMESETMPTLMTVMDGQTLLKVNA